MEPLIFLSHSGAQKDFTERLYYELVHLNHYPFFDQDAQHSLPRGQEFPARIVEACRHCKMGVVVLSHDYVESLWPMLELEQFLFHSKADINVYPLFYKLKPADLTSQENLQRWQSKWNKEASSWQSTLQRAQISIDISLWPQALEKLKHRSGEVPHPNKRDHAYIQKIVSSICLTLPPPCPDFLDDKFIKGGPRMALEIANRFQQCVETTSTIQDSISNQVSAMGVYGVGGSGKTTLCKNMASMYNKDFPGRSWYLELPSEKDEKQLLKELKKVLQVLVQISDKSLKKISTADQAISILKEQLKGYQVFLAIDNVWEWAFESTSQIVGIEYMAGSKLMVTSRYEQLLRRLLPSCTMVPVPSITEQEAEGALLSYSAASSFSHAIPVEDLRSLARSCFFRDQCHPLLLRAMGVKLRAVGGRMQSAEDWKNYISRLLQGCSPLDDDIEDTVLSVLKTSYLALSTTLQSIFLDLVNHTPDFTYFSLSKVCEWLSKLHQGCVEDDMRPQVILLEYNGLVDLTNERVMIHDLYKTLARRVGGPNADRVCLFEGDQISLRTAAEWTNLKYIRIDSTTVDKSHSWSVLRHCSDLEIFMLAPPIQLPRFSVQGMGSLRILHLNCKHLKEMKDWKKAPNLVSVELYKCDGLQKVGNIGCLHKLEKLAIKCRAQYGSVIVDLPDLTECCKLKTLVFSCKYLKRLSSLGQPPKLQELNLSSNINLVDVGTICNFTALEELKLSGCLKLQQFPIVNSSNLRTLDLSMCKNLVSMRGNVCALTALEELNLFRCRKLERIPDLKNLDRLRLLTAEGCSSLKELKGVSGLPCLQSLDLTGCISLVPTCTPDLSSLSALEFLGLPCLEQVQIMPHTNDVVRLEPGGINEGHDSQMDCAHLVGLVNLRRLWIADTSWRMSSLANLEDLRQSLQVIPGLSALVNLRWLKLSACSSLRQIPGLGALTNLENLVILEVQIADSSWNISSLDVSALANLEVLRVYSLQSLQVIPGLSALANLKELFITLCSSLKQIPGLGALTNLEELIISDCPSLEALPDLRGLTSLNFLSLRRCSSLQAIPGVDVLFGLKFLWLEGDTTSVQNFLPLFVTPMEIWITLHGDPTRSETSAETLPDLTNVSGLFLEDFPDLRALPDLPPKRLRHIALSGCSSLKDLSSLTSLTSLIQLSVTDCTSLRNFPDLSHLKYLRWITLRGCPLLRGVVPQVSKTTSVETEEEEEDGAISTLRSKRWHVCCET